MSAALIIDGHPNADSLTASIADRYAAGYGDARVLRLRDLRFDPHMRNGYRAHMPLERDLEDAKHALHDAKRIVITTPLWWGSVPALLQAFFDRALLPREEYRYNAVGMPEGLLRGRRGRIFLLADTPLYLQPFLGTPAAPAIRRNTLALCGVKPAPIVRLGNVGKATPARIDAWLAGAERHGERDGRRDASRPQPARLTFTFADTLSSAGDTPSPSASPALTSSGA